MKRIRAVVFVLAIMLGLVAGASIIIEGPAHAAGSDGTGTMSGVFKTSISSTASNTSLQTGTFSDSNVTDTTFLALVMTADSGTNPNNSVSSVTSTGSGCASVTLSWTLAKRENTQWGTAEAWWGRNLGGGSVGGSTPCRVTATWTEGTPGSVGVFLAHGSNMSAPTVTSAQSASGQPKVSVTTAAGDLALGLFQDYTGSLAKTPLTGQSKLYEYPASSGDTWTALWQNPATPHAVGTYDIGVTQTSRKFNAVGVVVKPKAVAPGDTTAPTWPTNGNLAHSGTTDSSTALSWETATDNVAVTGYRVYKDGTAITPDVTTGTSLTVSGLTASTTYAFKVKALDAAGNVSADSNTDSVTTSAAPPATMDCMPDPSACGYPDTDTSGIVTSECPNGLTVVNGDKHLTTASTTYSCWDIRGAVYVDASSVTFKNSKVKCACDYAIRVGPDVNPSFPSVTAFTFLQGEIDLDGYDNGKAIAQRNYTLKGSYIHNGADCAHGDGTQTIEDNLCVTQPDGMSGATLTSWCSANGAHIDGFQTDGNGSSDVFIIKHNTVKNPCGQTSAIITGTNTSPVYNMRVENNLMAGGGWTLYCAGPDAGGTPIPPGGTSYFKDNRFARTYYTDSGFYGPMGHCWNMPSGTVTGNVWDVDNTPAPV